MKKLSINHNEKGFTLIELMIVIAIIGILAAIAIPNYISYRDKAYCSAAESDANSIMGTLADWYAVPKHITGVAIAAVGPGVTTAVVDTDTITFKALSNGNTAVISYAAPTTTVLVTDVSGRCPLTYRTSQTLAGWSTTANTFTKTM